VIRRLLVASGAVLVPLASFGLVSRRGARRLLAAPRTAPEERGLAPAVDALGGEVIRLRARDGVRLAARWLPAIAGPADDWVPDPHEAIVLLHGYSGSIAPDLVEYGPFLRRTAGVLGLDFRGHGGSADGPTTFGLLEIEDVAGALAWLGERGIRRVALVGTSMGGIVAIAATAVLGDGTLDQVDASPTAPIAPAATPRPLIVGLVGDSVTPEIRVVVAGRIGGPLAGFMADRVLAGAAGILGEDIRTMEPARMLPLLEGLPVLLVQGAADDLVPPAAAHRLADLGGPSVETWVVPAAGHSRAHATDPAAYEERVTSFLRRMMAARRG
jgi:pimeloyl-ACP methyl ester carboxylesterase